VDSVRVLTDSVDAGAYWRKLKQRLTKEGSQVVTFCHGLKLMAPDGKRYLTDCANTEGLLRIVQSIPSPKAEPFKRWLARVGFERIQEIEDPELATKRTRFLYNAKRENLRDHMDDLELIFSMLGEASTTRITTAKNAIGFRKNEKAAREGGKIAGDARRALERKSRQKISTRRNYLKGFQKRKLISS